MTNPTPDMTRLLRVATTLSLISTDLKDVQNELLSVVRAGPQDALTDLYLRGKVGSYVALIADTQQTIDDLIAITHESGLSIDQIGAGLLGKRARAHLLPDIRQIKPRHHTGAGVTHERGPIERLIIPLFSTYDQPAQMERVYWVRDAQRIEVATRWVGRPEEPMFNGDDLGFGWDNLVRFTKLVCTDEGIPYTEADDGNSPHEESR